MGNTEVQTPLPFPVSPDAPRCWDTQRLMLFRLFVDINMPSAWDAACPALKANVHLFKAQLRCPLLREAVPSTVPLQATWHFPPDRELSEVGGGGGAAQVGTPQRGLDGCRRRWQEHVPPAATVPAGWKASKMCFQPLLARETRDSELLPRTQGCSRPPTRGLRAWGPAT